MPGASLSSSSPNYIDPSSSSPLPKAQVEAFKPEIKQTAERLRYRVSDSPTESGFTLIKLQTFEGAALLVGVRAAEDGKLCFIIVLHAISSDETSIQQGVQMLNFPKQVLEAVQRAGYTNHAKMEHEGSISELKILAGLGTAQKPAIEGLRAVLEIISDLEPKS